MTKKQELRLWLLRRNPKVIHSLEKFEEEYKQLSHLSDEEIDVLINMNLHPGNTIPECLRALDFVLKESA